MEYRILGPLEVVDESGSRVGLTARKQRELLLALLLHPNEVVTTDQLADALWGERPPASARKLLQVYVSQLRRALGDAAVETRPAGYAIRAGAEEIDAARFERLLAEGREALAAGSAELAASLLRRALALWRGPALAEVAYADFAAGHASRLDELRLACLEERIAADLASGRDGEVLAEVEALVGEHPLRERLRASLMLALYRCGRQADALEAYRQGWRTFREELGLEPSAELRDLERAILRQDPALAPPRRERMVSLPPAPVTPLIGRAAEVAALRALVLRSDVRLVTVAGAGGTGKTRLALALAEECRDEFANGCVFVELAALRDPDLVLPTVARALGVPERAGEPVAPAVSAWLVARELLLILDNVEHLVEAGATLVELAVAAPRLALLVTSRRVLHLSGEYVFPLAPLADDDAVELFVQRARARRPAFAMTADAERDVREICRRVDGVPLAIELAAARTGTLTVAALRERLAQRLSVLTGGPRDLPARQQTLRETLDWSADLLRDHERRALARIALFPGGCTLESAERVADADVDTLAALVDHHLVTRVEGQREARFVELETIREYGQELLGDKRGPAERAFAAYFRDLAEAADLRGPGQREWITRLDAELDNLRAALDYAAASDERETELRLVGALWRYWWVRGHLAEGRTRIDRALERARGGGADPLMRARALHGGAGLAWSAGDYARARALASDLLATAQAARAGFEELSAHTVLGVTATKERDFETARTHLERSAALAAELGRQQDVAVAKLNLGVNELEAGNAAAAVPFFADVLDHHRHHGAGGEGEGFALLNLGLAARELGDLATARARFEAAAAVFDSVGFRAQLAHALQGLAAVQADTANAEAAARLLGQADGVLAEVGVSSRDFDIRLAREVEATAREELGDEAFAVAYDEGKRYAERP